MTIRCKYVSGPCYDISDGLCIHCGVHYFDHPEDRQSLAYVWWLVKSRTGFWFRRMWWKLTPNDDTPF